jgi:polyhydroxyalkanoate synthesis repressor PhaR
LKIYRKTHQLHWLLAIHSVRLSASGSFACKRDKLVSSSRLIKKYPNRRLYDCIESRYIKLVDVRNLVTEKLDFVVIEQRGGANITREILLQVIAILEQRPDALLSTAFMVNLIRAYGRGSRSEVSGQLEQVLRPWAERPLEAPP